MKNIIKTSRSNKAITLIAMVITIIVLLILAGVTIGFAINNTGLLKKAKISTDEYNNSVNKENNELEKMIGYIDSNRNSYSNDYIDIQSDLAKRIISNTGKKYIVDLNTLFNDKRYVEEIKKSSSAVDYILSDNDVLNEAIDSQYMMTSLLNSEDKDSIVTKLLEKSSTNPQLTSTNGSDGGSCFGTAPFPDYGYQIYWGFNENNEYAYYGTGGFHIGYRFNEPFWCFKFSFKQRFTSEGVDNLYVQYSDDGSNWIDATNKIITSRDSSNPTQEYIVNKSIGKHLYWRITGNGYGSNGGLSNLIFYGIK